ncbi:MAG: Maf family protein [Clostridiales bacterium]|nr:Maf family protein [Clostridiales bacterium]
MLPHIVLASKSPRRRELLTMLGVTDFEIIPAASEAEFPSGIHPGEAAISVALGKAEEIAPRAPEGVLILAADTVVSLEGRILEKPADEDEAFAMLSALSGRSHTVYSGVVLIQGGKKLCRYEATDVRFRSLGEDEIRRYIATGEPMDKAGAYGAQGMASVFIERIDGDFFNVVGLPICTLGRMLEEFGYRII